MFQKYTFQVYHCINKSISLSYLNIFKRTESPEFTNTKLVLFSALSVTLAPRLRCPLSEGDLTS